MEKEVWKDIPGYEGMYQVSSEGRVKSLERYVDNNGGLQKCRERYLLQSKNKSGYNGVNLSRDNERKTYVTHILVAISFLNHIPSGCDVVVDHINNDRIDNRLGNLQIITQRENSTKDRKPSSGFTGAVKIKSGKYKSQITYKRKKYYLGMFDTPEEAHGAYLNKLKEIEHIKKR